MWTGVQFCCAAAAALAAGPLPQQLLPPATRALLPLLPARRRPSAFSSPLARLSSSQQCQTQRHGCLKCSVNFAGAHSRPGPVAPVLAVAAGRLVRRLAGVWRGAQLPSLLLHVCFMVHGARWAAGPAALLPPLCKPRSCIRAAQPTAALLSGNSLLVSDAGAPPHGQRCCCCLLNT